MISLATESGVARLMLRRPEKRNALSPEMLGDLAAAPAKLADDARCILLGGEGNVFCAGFDLTLCRDDDDALAALLRGLSVAIGALQRSPVPVVACATGAAIAGGCALLAGADIVVVDRDCKLGYPVLRLGISPAVSAPTLRARLGAGPARVRLLDTRLIRGEEAGAIGLAHQVCQSPEEARRAAATVAADLAAKPPRGLTATKRWLNELDRLAPSEIQQALQVSLDLVGSGEQRERFAALWT